MSRCKKKCPPAVGATEGASIALGANATLSYTPTQGAGKDRIKRGNRTFQPGFPQPEKGARETVRRARPPRGAPVTFRGSMGRIWAYTGKRGRVLQMLATMGQGVTQWDCLPWHTRLGASIHVLRRAGLVIETALEGDYRHARYTLHTPGSLLIQGETGNGSRARNAS